MSLALLLSTHLDTTINVTGLLVIILVLLLLSAIVAGAKAAFFSLSDKDIDFLKTKNSDTARQVVRMIGQPKILFLTILVINTFLNIAIVTSCHILLMEVLPKSINPQFRLALDFVIIGLIILFFAVVLPKVYAVQNSKRMALFSAPIMSGLRSVFRPISNMLVSTNRFVEQKMSQSGDNQMTINEFDLAIEETLGHTVSPEEVNILRSILRFNYITAKQVMTTRMDISAIEIEKKYAEVIGKLRSTGYSRMPVYKGNLDTIAGIIYTKELLPFLEQENFDWQTKIKAPLFIPESKNIEDLMKEFQQKRTHIAIVVDEFGGTSGLVTLEDIVEEITGDIHDEFDQIELLYKKVDEQTYLFDGKISLNDMCRHLRTPPETFAGLKGQSDTLGGLLLEVLKRFPNVNETVSIRNFSFTILSLNHYRIDKVKVNKMD